MIHGKDGDPELKFVNELVEGRELENRFTEGRHSHVAAARPRQPENIKKQDVPGIEESATRAQE